MSHYAGHEVTEERFAILTYGSTRDLINASTDKLGRPCGYANLLGYEDDPSRVQIIGVTTLPIADDPGFLESFPGGFRLLITYRATYRQVI